MLHTDFHSPMTCNLENTIKELSLPLIEAQGLVLWGLEVIAGPALKVGIYIDTPPGTGDSVSATIDQCESISRQLGLALEVEDCIDKRWVLEVSSPGLERRFFNLAQMRPYTGDMIEVKLKSGTGQRRVWRGRLLEVTDTDFEIQPASVSATGEITPDHEAPMRITWESVARARRIHIFVIPQKPGKTASIAKKTARK